MNLTIVEGDLLDQEVEVIVNAWNRNIIPWWLLLPQGVSGQSKKELGTLRFGSLEKWEQSRSDKRRNVGWTTAIQIDHPCCRNQYVLAILRKVNS